MNSDSAHIDASKWCSRIREIWSPLADGRRIIPFCTPLRRFADALVVRINHSDFVAGGGQVSEDIADSYSVDDLSVNTFVAHDHKFAHGLRSVAERAGLRVTDTWMGTNRCAIQAGPEGIKELETTSGFIVAQIAMDGLLKEVIA